MKSIFNHLLALLAIFDNAYLMLTLLETLRRNFWSAIDLLNHLYCHVLYPMRNICLCCTIFLAMSLAVERWRAIRSKKGLCLMPQPVTQQLRGVVVFITD
jgi:hypothetical protein